MFVYSQDATDAKRQMIEGALCWKWGLQTILDVSHPYRTVQPSA